MEYLGRIDQQVKIRGYRIEPGEIENKIKSIPGLEQVAVLPVESIGGDLELIAFFKGALGGVELANQIKILLPSFMLPSAYIQIEEWPLTVNGKLDKNALLEHHVSTNSTNSSPELPETFHEQKMIAIWADVLGLEPAKIGLDVDFFELGGQSLKAIRLINRMNRELEMNVNLSDLFESGTIRSLCQKYPHGVFKKAGVELVKFHTPDNASSKHLFYIPPIVGVPVGPDGLLVGLKDYHTWGFIYTPEEDFIKHPELTALGGYVRSVKHNWITACRAFEYSVGQNLHKLAQHHLGFLFVIPGAAGVFKTADFNSPSFGVHSSSTAYLIRIPEYKAADLP
jgi:acyl carrier protein